MFRPRSRARAIRLVQHGRKFDKLPRTPAINFHSELRSLDCSGFPFAAISCRDTLRHVRLDPQRFSSVAATRRDMKGYCHGMVSSTGTARRFQGGTRHKQPLGAQNSRFNEPFSIALELASYRRRRWR